MPSSSTPRKALPSTTFERLSQTLNAANTLHSSKAFAFASTTCRTFHAQKRAAKLGLAVNIRRAVNCPQNRVSHLPLPVLDQAPSHVVPSKEEKKRRRPALRLDIPRGIPITVDRPTGSAQFSIIDLVTPPVAIPAPQQLGDPAFLVATRQAPVPVTIVLDESDDELDAFELVYPTSDIADLDSDSSSSASMMSTADSSSSASSSGPCTPSDVEMSEPTTSSAGKRKMNEDYDGEVSDAVCEKRPKYKRKSWTHVDSAPRTRKLCQEHILRVWYNPLLPPHEIHTNDTK
ncbi:hypothetical protein C8F01DRAFT_1232464 [Mycena amicta]|nr:hypothetical protein C8F01DRAFT_1232464 [Mycena amicta]